jgi:hypothetical protein
MMKKGEEKKVLHSPVFFIIQFNHLDAREKEKPQSTHRPPHTSAHPP